MKVYSLAVNGKPIVEVEVEAPRWLPVRPALNREWLRRIVAAALAEYFQRSPVRESS
jgi:hypothetical protein